MQEVRRASMQIARIWVVVAAVVVTPLESFCAGDTTNAPTMRDTLSLDQARETAFQRNWDLLAAKSGVDLATAQEAMKLASHKLPIRTKFVSRAEEL